MRRLRILYVHGLESVYGRKAKALAKHHDVLCPDMQVSFFETLGEIPPTSLSARQPPYFSAALFGSLYTHSLCRWPSSSTPAIFFPSLVYPASALLH